MNLRRAICLAVFIPAMSAIMAEESPWTDVTKWLLVNPNFDNNSQEGWNWESNATTQEVRVNCISFYNGSFDIHQQLTSLPKGKYRLSVQGFYRTTDNQAAYTAHQNGTEQITASLYAGTVNKKLVSAYAESVNYNAGGRSWTPDNTHYFPDGKEAALEAFGVGHYTNTMEFEAEGNIMVGVSCQSYTSNNYCVLDNFKLEYYGALAHASEIVLNPGKQAYTIGEKGKINSEVKPQDAVITRLIWSSSNPAVMTVDGDGNITAMSDGKATITATTIDGSNISASVMLEVIHNKPTAGSLVINEMMASNVDEFISPAFNFDGWIELYNPTDQTVELGGLRISDPANGEGPWTTPVTMGALAPKSFAVIWFDSNYLCATNAPFKLDSEGGTIVIADEEGNEIVRQDYPASIERVSYARVSDGDGEWGNTATPTPGSSNNGILTAKSQLAAPVVNQPSQLFTGQLSVSVDIPEGATLRYTTNGTLPTKTHGLTSKTGHFTVRQTTSYRFRLFADGALPSTVTARSYIMRDRNYMLPVISVITDPDFLYSSEIGVMTTGPNGRPGNGRDDKCNWNMDWERPVNFSYLTADGEMALNQDVNLEMCGGWSRAWEPHSFKLKGNKELGGDKNLLYPFFDLKPYIRNRTLQIRNGGNDTQCRFKDPSLQYMVQTSGLNLDCQSYQPIHEFINGKYIGVLNMREPNNKHYVYANYGWDEEDIDQFEMSPDSGYVQKCGTPDAFNELVDVLSPNAAISSTYEEICRQLDIDAYANYMALEMYLGNWDWPQNNIKGFRHRDGGRFRFVLYDLDGSFSTNEPYSTFAGKEIYTFDQLRPASLGRIKDKIRFVTLFKNLLKNDSFRRRYIDAYCIMGGSVFEKNRASGLIDYLLQRVEPAMKLNGGSAQSTANQVRNNLNGRLSTAISDLRRNSVFRLNNTTAQNVTLSSDTEGAVLTINGQPIPTGRFSGSLFAPVKLRAYAPAGYAFKGWVNAAGTLQLADEEISLPSGTVKLTATFRPLSDGELRQQGITPVRINEVSGANDSFIDEYGKKGDWLELYNTTSQPVDVEGMYLTDNLKKPDKYQITKGKTHAQTVIPPHGYLIIWCDNKRATTDHGLHATFKISDDGGQLQLMAADRSWTDVISYPAQDARTTVSRYPDGATQVYTTNVATIGQANMKTSYSVETDQPQVVSDGIHTAEAVNGFRLCYGADQLLVKSGEQGQAAVSVYTADGQLVSQSAVQLTAGTTYVSIDHLPAGFYVARATNSQGQVVSCKFVK